ncbi:MAG: T9SS type A sorting domain-containing protein [Bacteroidetes bacterium]|nr:T9SS type A sorting domain-containing protein [Bacteroidota bacterium]
MKKIIYSLCMVILASLSGQCQIAAWDFYGQSFPVTCAATTFHMNLEATGGANNITRGSGAPASGGVNSFRTTGFQNNGISTAANDYFQVTLRAIPGYKLSLTTLDAKFNGTASFFSSPGVTSQFAYSLDGVTFILIGNPLQSTALTMAQVDLSGIADLQNVYSTTTVTLRYYASGQTTTGGWGFYSGSPGTNGLAVGGTVTEAIVMAPSLQASNITFSNVQQTRMGVSWTPGNGEKRVVMINTTNSFTDPVNGTDPAANPVYAGSGEQVVYNYSGSSIPSVSGLVAGMNYWFRIYEYNGSGILTVYNDLPAANNPKSQATSGLLLAPSVISPSATQVTTSGAILGGHITSDGGTPVTERGTLWKTSAPVTIGDNKLSDGLTDTGFFSHPRTGLPSATQIHYAAYATNAAGTALSPEATFFTLAAEPPSHVTGFSATSAGTTSIQLSWNPLITGADGYLILQKQGTVPPAGMPADASQYANGSGVGDATVAANITVGTTGIKNITGLSPGTSYAFSIFPYAWDGVNQQTTNYYTQLPVPGATATTGIPAVVTYHWTGTAGNDWNTAGNWNPSRTIPALNDILVFDAGGVWTIINVPAQTIGQLHVLGNTAVTLQGVGPLNVAGDAGEDLAVSWGCQLNISGSGAISISLAAGAAGVVSGSMTFSGGGHRLLAASAGGVDFTSGSIFKAGSGFTGNPFGTVNLNSVIFNAGSVYVSQAGGNPFGAAAPASVVVFQPGSLYRIDAYSVPSFGGRTYGNFEMNYPGSITATGSSAVSIDNFTATQGTFYLNMTGSPGHSIRGNISIANVATLIVAPATAGTVMLNGTSPQAISGSGSFMAGTFSTIGISNSSGVTLSMNARFNNVTVAAGGLFTIAPNAELTVTGNLVNGAPATGFVIESDASVIHNSSGVPGTVKRNIPAATWSDWQDGWHLLSTPVAGQSINEAGGFVTTGAGNDFDLLAWWEPGNEWVNFKNATIPPVFSEINGSGNFELGKGYLAAYQQPGDKIFTGDLNVADIQVVNLTSTGATASNRGWHLLGNPFPCALNWYTGWTTNNIGSIAYIWNETGMSYTPRNPGEAIPACNGFMVQVTGSQGVAGSLTIPASQRIHDSQAWFKENEVPVIKLFARSLGQPSFQESQVRFNPLSTIDFDPGFDGRFLPGYAPLFYSRAGGEKLAVNVIPKPELNQCIPFSFEKNSGVHFQIEAQITGEMPSMVLLLDKKTGIVHNLTINPLYEFSSEDGDSPDRFGIMFSQAGTGEPPGAKTHVFSFGNCLVVRHSENTRLEIFSITGQPMVMRDLKGTGTGKVVLDVPASWYLVRVTTGKNVEVTKIFVQSSH